MDGNLPSFDRCGGGWRIATAFRHRHWGGTKIGKSRGKARGMRGGDAVFEPDYRHSDLLLTLSLESLSLTVKYFKALVFCRIVFLIWKVLKFFR